MNKSGYRNKYNLVLENWQRKRKENILKESEKNEESTGTERTERVKERKRRRHDTTKPATGHKFKN